MDSSELNDQNLHELGERIESLITLCQQLRQENQTLRTNEQQWKQERASLVEKNEIARTRVEAMIGRLKALEHES
ncbi:TIGR02449 family protein [Sansalvadorimonas verongulae]|uniref:TIGR02449 family protein n=1 Tax=Sansalvadorimonas verongulae TaxID=2172824 RepID=UPI0012BB8A37|nr:TIGR02449 family protein [Sansalvadorimonas verongulae]MTI13305.1 TIGR02449 family protein [Sansalvadorimonas verongulae]